MDLDMLIKSVQYAVDNHGRVTAIVIQPWLWRQLIEALEDAEDRALVKALNARLAAGPLASAAMRWDEVANQ